MNKYKEKFGDAEPESEGDGYYKITEEDKKKGK